MPFVDLPAGTWTTIATLSADSIFQNKGHRNIFITTEDTTGLDLDEGASLGPAEAIQVLSGAVVKGSPAGGPGIVYYTGV